MANPPITIGQFDNVPAPGSPIRSDWPQEISQAVTALQALTEWRESTITLAGQALTTSQANVGNVSLGTRGYNRAVIVSVGLLLSLTSIVSANAVDTFLSITAGHGTTRRVRQGLIAGSQMGSALTAVFFVPANAASTVAVGVSVNAGTATAATSGGADLNYVQASMIPLPAGVTKL